MKILFISPYRDGSGWSRAGIDYIKALNTTGLDIVIRPLKLNNYSSKLDDELIKLESKSTVGTTVCIQHALPNYMEYKPGMLNIGLFVTETDSAPFTNWVRKLNLMDVVWVVNNDMIEWCKNNGVTKPVHLIPHACDVSKYNKIYPKFDLPNDGKFTFYFIGELTRRKNITALLRAFHIEFSYNEPVSLVLKVNKSGMNSKDVYKEISMMCEKNKHGLRLYKDVNRYHKELIIPEYLSEEEINGLHQACDCFVMPSFGEAWSYPAFDAMGFGKTPICTNIGGMKDFIDKGGFLINGNMEPVVGCDEVVPRLNIAHENWYNIDVNLLRKAMRFIYQFSEHDMVNSVREYGKADVLKYSYENIGKVMKDGINKT